MFWTVTAVGITLNQNGLHALGFVTYLIKIRLLVCFPLLLTHYSIPSFVTTVRRKMFGVGVGGPLVHPGLTDNGKYCRESSGVKLRGSGSSQSGREINHSSTS